MTIEEKKVKSLTKFVRIPLILHTTLKRENGFSLQIEHVEVKKTTIVVPKDILELSSREIGEYVKEVYPNAKSVVIQYEDKEEGPVPFCVQLFLTGKNSKKREINTEDY
ncbi:MAG: hypothetical protein ACKD6N_03230 [Candidatus Bathyarchaeota archaeon]